MDATLLPRSLTSTPFLPSPLSPDFLGAAVVTTSCPVEDDLSPRPPLTSPPTISPSLLYQPSPIPLLPSSQARAPSSQDCAKLLNYPPTARRSSAQPASSWDAAVLAPAGHIRLPTMGELLARIPSALPQAERVLSSQPLRPDKVETGGPPAVMPFISKLYHMLSHPEELQDVLVWDADGEAFIVHASDRLVQEVFPQVFGHGNFASFTRQLNVYSFRRLSPPELRTRLSIPPSSSYSAWAHPLFTRDNDPDTLHLLAPRPNKARERNKREKRERERERENERDDGRERSEKMRRRMAG